MRRLFRSNSLWRGGLFVGLILVVLPVLTASLVSGEGSRTLYPAPIPGRFRAHLEWTARTYGGGDSPVVLARRTLLRLYARQGEQILLGSSGIDVSAIDSGEPNLGDILVYNPGTVTGPIGQEVLPALAGAADPPQFGAFANGFSCNAQRDAVPGGAGSTIARRNWPARSPTLAATLPASTSPRSRGSTSWPSSARRDPIVSRPLSSVAGLTIPPSAILARSSTPA